MLENRIDIYSEYADFNEKQKILIDLLKKTINAFKILEIKTIESNLSILEDKIKSNTFKVIVLGEFKRGKSTFINAMLGEEVLPAFATPCTAVINEIKWSPEKKAVLHFKNPKPSKIPDNLPKNVYEHIKKYRDKIEPITIDINQLEEYVVIKDPEKSQEESVAETPYSKVELFWPLELCEHGIEIIDSPGLNEHSTREKITLDYIANVDAVLFVLSCQALASQSEIQVINENVRDSGHEYIYFIANRFDQVRDREKERLVNFGREKLKDKTSFGTEGIFFISAADALDGRLDNNMELIEKSGLIPLEEHLAQFLTKKRGKIKLLQPLRMVKNEIEKARDKIIPSLNKSLKMEIEEIEKKYETIKPKLTQAEKDKVFIIEKIERHRNELKDKIKKKTTKYINELVEEIPKWAEGHQLENKIKFFTISPKTQEEKLVKEVTTALSELMREDKIKWAKEVIEPLVKKDLKDLESSLEQNLQNFISSLEDIQCTLFDQELNIENNPNNTSAVERILSAAGGFVVGGIGSALVGGTLGFNEMAKSLIPNFALAFGMLVLGFNPITIIPTLLAAGTIQGLLTTDKTSNKLKKEIANQIVRKLREDKGDTSDEFAQEIYNKTGKIQIEIGNGLQSYINEVKEQVEASINNIKKGEEFVKEKIKEISNCQELLNQSYSQLNELIFDLLEQ